ncbi:MAG: hypothetical protein CVU84_00175 [Firmicutes bacterium HGW-Firmicutes-1]|jgi:hypothetical protein|nr:MAG: hypothetical protein CVU84_00175 [Firmicutes bacterium HGW-Firmicutes-1]
MKNIFNQKGSTLLMVIIMSAVLTVLGTAMLSMTFMNLNMKYNDERGKKAVYYSESGIDEVYALVGTKVEYSLETAKMDTDIYRRALLAHLEKTLIPEDPDHPEIIYPGEVRNGAVLKDPMTGTEYIKNSGISEGVGFVKFYIEDSAAGIIYEDKVLNTTALMKELDKNYKEKFMTSFDTLCSSSIVTDISSGTLGLSHSGSFPVISAGSVIDFSSSSNDTFTISDVHSVFTYGKTEREITTNIIVKAPERLYPVTTIRDTIQVENNPIWQNAFVSNQDIIFNEDTDVSIQGDIYALGTEDAGGVLQGILLNEAKVTIMGDLVTQKNIQTTGTGDQLTVNHGLLYSDSLITKAGADHSQITINNGNVYTNDDLELNALQSSISILNGSYYGISDGGASHNTSSAIVVNAPLTGATLSISGTAPTLSNDKIWNSKNVFSESGVWIPGTAYVDIVGDITGGGNYWPYQTGESVSVKENYLAYALPLTISEASKYDDHNTIKKLADNGIYFAVGAQVPPSITEEYYTTLDKINFFMEVNKVEEFKEYLEFGTPTTLDISNYKYVLGAKILKDGTINKADYTAFEQPILERFRKIQGKVQYDFLYYLRNTTNYTNLSSPTSEPLYLYDEFENIILPEQIDGSFNVIKELVEYGEIEGSDSKPIVYPASYVHKDPALLEQATEIIFVSNPNSTVKRNIRLVGNNPGTNNGYENIVSLSGTNNGYFQGIIITQGNVLIDGDVHFTGTIIAGGSITVRKGNSTFYNSDRASVKFMAKLIRDNPSLRGLFDSHAIGNPIQFVEDEVDDSDAEDSNMNNTYKQLVGFEFWRLN